MSRDATVAARVPHDLRADLEKIATRDHVELSIVVRRLLREGAERELAAGAPVTESLFARGGTARRRPTATELEAKLKVAPRAGTQRFRALAEFELAGPRGLTADEVCASLAPIPVNGTARRVTDLLQAEFIRPRLPANPHQHGPSDRVALYVGERIMDDGHVARQTRAGAWANVYVITSAGHRALEDARAKQRAKAGA